MYGFGEFKIVANICMEKKNPLPNGINSDFKKPKEMTCNLNVFSCARLSPTQCLLLHNYLKGDGFAINLKGNMEEWEEHRFRNPIWV